MITWTSGNASARFRLGTTGYFLLVALPLLVHSVASAASVFTTRPDDPRAVYLTAHTFGARGDGASDDTPAIQAALDKAASASGGIVFVPSGRYRLTRTLYVWRAVRVIGYGATRPVFVLGANTPGFQKGLGLMVLFSHGRPGAPAPGGARVPFPPPGTVPPNENVPDANQSTFYSSMANVDFEIGPGNPAAVAIRFHVAQHGVLSHMDFRIGSGLAALIDVGNAGHHLRFYGGRYGILTTPTSPSWPFTLVDCSFEGQRDAAIREHVAGLTLVRTTFRNLPIGIEIDPHYSDRLWVKDSRFENVSRAAVVISNEKNATTQIGVEGAVCSNVPVFARFRESGRTQPGGAAVYRVRRFNHGLFVPAPGSSGRLDTQWDAEPLSALPPPLPEAIRTLPPSDTWVNVHTLGVKGDGESDDTEAIRKAVAHHRVLYFPSGFYFVRDTIALAPNTVLISLHPGTTVLALPDGAAGYAGVGAAKPLLEAPQGGTNIVSGIGIFTGGDNPRATGVRWMAAENSLLDDVHFHGFAGTLLPPETRKKFYGAASAGPFGPGRWGAQYPSLWVTRGGGTFNNVWSPNTFAQSGMYVSDTTTPGRVYQLSAEHHLFSEIKLERVENWEFHAPQTEEEASTSAEAVAVEVHESRNVTFANLHMYRVTRSYAPFPAGVRTYASSEIRFRNVRVNAEHGYAVCDEDGCGTFLRAGKFPFETAVQDVTRGREVRERQFAVLDVTAESATPAPADAPAVVAPDAALERLAGGFHSTSGAAVDASGTLYFVDRPRRRIFSWSQQRGLNVVSDAPLDPVSLAVDRSGALLVVSSAGPNGTVYSIRPHRPYDIAVLEPQRRAPRPGAAAVVPTLVWADGQFRSYLDLATYEYTTLSQMFAREVTTRGDREFVSPDGSLFMPAGRVFRQGPDGAYPGMDATGWRWSHVLDAYALAAALPGRRVYVASGAENRTYRATVQADGTLGNLEPFAERGGEAVAVDIKGNVYVANGQIFAYDSTGKPIAEIVVPERPSGLAFGGSDRRTLFILTHRTLYAVRMQEPGVE